MRDIERRVVKLERALYRSGVEGPGLRIRMLAEGEVLPLDARRSDVFVQVRTMSIDAERTRVAELLRLQAQRRALERELRVQ